LDHGGIQLCSEGLLPWSSWRLVWWRGVVPRWRRKWKVRKDVGALDNERSDEATTMSKITPFAAVACVVVSWSLDEE
jgi:hypothetical protein